MLSSLNALTKNQAYNTTMYTAIQHNTRWKDIQGKTVTTEDKAQREGPKSDSVLPSWTQTFLMYAFCYMYLRHHRSHSINYI